jgi:hypothetical protein
MKIFTYARTLWHEFLMWWYLGSEHQEIGEKKKTLTQIGDSE